MKTLFLLLSLSFGLEAFAIDLPLVMKGKTTNGRDCTLTIESWEFNPELPREWFALKVKARSNWQLPENPSIEVSKSPSPWSLYGKTSGNYDQLAISLNPGKLNPPEAVANYSFQTWDENRKLVQEYCRFYQN